MQKDRFVSAIVAAAGQGKRMNMAQNKQYLMLLGKPVLAHTLQVFEDCEDIDEIIVVARIDEVDYCRKSVINAFGFKKVAKVVAGGEERQQSIMNGLAEVDSRCNVVMIHDGARPFVKEEQLINSIKEVIEYKAVGVGVPVKDTIKIVDKNNWILETPDRSSLWAIQTPQTFDYELIKKAHEKAVEEGFLGTDDTVLVERLGKKVKMIMGGYDNIKITTKEDLPMGEEILKARQRKGESI